MGREWRLLLLGGASGVGKSTLARAIARDLNVSWLQVDSIWLALCEATTKETHPLLHLFRDLDGPWFELDMDEMLAKFLELCCAVSRVLGPLLEHELNSNSVAILEGTWITPEFAARACENSRVRTVFLDESDPDRLQSAMIARAQGATWNERRQMLAELSWRHGEWLRSECKRLGLPLVSAWPHESLSQRTLRACGPGTRDYL